MRSGHFVRSWLAGGILVTCLASPVGEGEEAVRPHSRARARFAHLEFAEFRDLDGSGDASAGDEVVLGLRRPLAPTRRVGLEDLDLAGAFDHWGDGARLLTTPGQSEIRVVLGRVPALSLYGTYHPGATGITPSQVRTLEGSVPVLPRPADRLRFTGERFADSAALRPYYGQLHAHSGFSDGMLDPAAAFDGARRRGLDFFAVTDHLEQLTPESWKKGLEEAREALVPGSFVALYGYEWGGYPTLRGWMNHVNVVGSQRTLSVLGTIPLLRLYQGLLQLPGSIVVGQFNHPGMLNAAIGRNNWDDFEYRADADLRIALMMVETRSRNGEDNREEAGLIPALDRGWHLGPKADEDNHHADWGSTRERTGLWIERLDAEAVLGGLSRMATFYTDDPDASLKLRADRKWLMGSTVYGDGPHLLEVEIGHRTRAATVTSVQLVSRAGTVLADHRGGRTPLRLSFEVDPPTDTYFFVRVRLEQEQTRLLSAPIFVDR